MPGFVLLVRERGDGDPAMRYGITVTKKIGGAVIRNRMKRRFRVLARELLPRLGVAGADHVLIGRSESIEREFDLLRSELEKALGKVMSRPAGEHRPSSRKKPAPKSGVRLRKHSNETSGSAESSNLSSERSGESGFLPAQGHGRAHERGPEQEHQEREAGRQERAEKP